MYYKWSVGEDYPEEKVDVQYDYKHLDNSLFRQGQVYTGEIKPKFDVRFVRRGKGTMESLLAMDYSYMGDVLISKRFADKIEAYCPEDVQMIVPEVWADGQDVGEHFRVMNVLHLIPCMLVDPNQEEYLQPNVFQKEGELTGHHIARSSEMFGTMLIVSKSFAEMVYAAKINSVCFNPDNKYPATWNPLWPGIFYRNQKEYMAEVCEVCHKPKVAEDQKGLLYHIHDGDWWDLEDRLICCCG